MKPTGRRAALAKQPGMTWRDHLVMLLHVASEIEHALMVQYLYAAYSLGGDQVPGSDRPMVRRWQDNILTIAREEMGHFLSVQNLLCLLGGGVNLDRSDFPWDAAYYPFPFRLEPFSMASLSCYIYAEMPPDSAFIMPRGRHLPRRYREFEERDKKRIFAQVRERLTEGSAHHVDAVYEEIIDLIGDPGRIPDGVFQEDSYAAQASWDDWGRGYQPDPRLLDAEGNVAAPSATARAAHVMVFRAATRSQAVAALRAISGQGEAPHLGVDQTGEPSHFERFLEIYQEFEKISGWNPARDVPVNPATRQTPGCTLIEAAQARGWAHLFNLRYRMLLGWLAHGFRLGRTARADQPNLRGLTMHKVFGEMYHLKTIAGILMALPRCDADAKGAKFAGPPFEMPYSTVLPPTECGAWRLHRELLASALDMSAVLLAGAAGDGRQYLQTLTGLDQNAAAWIDAILAGGPSA